jgi:hypothetical protein
MILIGFILGLLYQPAPVEPELEISTPDDYWVVTNIKVKGVTNARGGNHEHH